MTDWAALVGRFDASAELGLVVAGVPLRVLTNDESIRERLAAYYEPYLADVDRTAIEVRLCHGAADVGGTFVDVRRGDGRKVKEAVQEVPGGRLVLKRSTGAIMGLWPGRAAAVGDLRANLNQGINLINACYAKVLIAGGYVLFHASAVSWGGRVAALAGPPGAGKSTSALHLVEQGFHFLSNDRVLARAGGDDDVEARGYPKQPRVNPGTLLHHPRLSSLLDGPDRAALGAMTRTELWGLERKSDVDLDAIYGPGTVELSGALRAIVLLRWQLDGRGFEVRQLTPSLAMASLPLFQKDLGVFDLDRPPRRPPTLEDRKAYAAVIDRVRVLEVTGGVDFSSLVDLVGDVLAK